MTLDEQSIRQFDVVLVATDHDQVDYAALASASPLIVDTRNVFQRHGLTGAHIVKA
ncbi:UDP-N-acetyl-D-glucosamine 6-dehydrogenase [compost metagenome]